MAGLGPTEDAAARPRSMARALRHLLKVRSQPLEQTVQLDLFASVEPAQHGAYLIGMLLEHAVHELLAPARELHLARALVVVRRAARDEAHALEAVDHAGHAGRPDQQPARELGEPEARLAGAA